MDDVSNGRCPSLTDATRVGQCHGVQPKTGASPPRTPSLCPPWASGKDSPQTVWTLACDIVLKGQEKQPSIARKGLHLADPSTNGRILSVDLRILPS